MMAMLIGCVGAEEFPIRMATEGRLHLTVPPEMPPLEHLEVSLGHVARGEWLKEEARRERLCDVSFPIDWWRWREVTLGFTPAGDGEVELSLNGPWAEKSPGQLWRQEVLWDDIRATGTPLENGGFSRGIEGWNSPWRPYPETSEWPLLGKPVGATWHGRPLVQKLAVKNGRRVELSFQVRAAVPEGFVEPRRLGDATPAHQAAARLERGVNLGNGWEAPPESWGLKFGVEDIDRIAASGFDHIRVPVGWRHWMQDGRISEALLAELEPVLRRALEKGLVVLLDWHGFEELCRDPAGRRAEFVGAWRTLARYFHDWPDGLWFELFNEPNGALEGEALNDLYVAALAAVRESNPSRIVVVDPGQWSKVGSLGLLRLPDDDHRIVVSVHCYEPFEFTHQGAGWVGLEALSGVVFPGPPDEPLAVPAGLGDRASWIEAYNTRPASTNPSSAVNIDRLMADAAAWAKTFGRPVHLGEFGAYRTADAASRKRYARAVREVAERHGIGWCWWEWKAGFGCWDAEAERGVLVEELIGR